MSTAPPREKYLHHVTLSTGHVRRSPRSEVSDTTIAALTPILTRALQSPPAPQPIPGQIGYTFSGGVHGRCCVVTVWGHSETGVREPVLTIGVATHSRCGAHLWRTLHESAIDTPVVTRVEECPPEPWCADRIEVGAVRHKAAMAWSGDFARCVAWTWLAIRQGGQGDD